MDPIAPRSLPADNVEIIPARELAARDAEVPASFALRFPARWRPSKLQNPHADAIERETLSWLRSYGIGCDAEEAEKLRKFNCAMYGGYSLPLADHASALLVTQFISLWLFWDDLQVEEEQGWDIEEVVSALCSAEPPRTASRYVAAWCDIGRRLRRTQSVAWLRNLGVTMRQWLENAKVETGLAKAFRRGRCPDFASAFECRTVSIGMYPTFHLIEYAEGLELPGAVHGHPLIIELKRLASRLVGMGNDLGGVAKDIDQRWLNLVLVLSQQSQLPVEDAFQRLVDIHNADVRAFDGLWAQLPSWGAETDRLVHRWIRAVRHNVHGFTLWEATAERYQELKAIAGGRALVAPVLSGIDAIRPLPWRRRGWARPLARVAARSA